MGFRLSRRAIFTCIALYFFANLLFLINIQFPRGHNFDEFHYVPSAKQFLSFQQNQNWEHPPLGKMIVAAGIAIWGDIPIGWRFMSTFFGAMTLLAMFVWGRALLRDESLALWIALITLINQLLYVQSRIGMLDTFMFAFIAWALAAFTTAWNAELEPSRQRRLFYFSGVMFGLGAACKWFAVIPWFACVGVVAAVRILQYWKMRFDDERPDDWYSERLWELMRKRDFALALIIIPVFVYLLTFAPLLYTQPTDHWGPIQILVWQKTMWDGQLRVVTNHPYMSSFKDWALMTRPIWYAFDKEGLQGETVRGVILLGNPLIMWAGLSALLFCFWKWIRDRSREAFLIVFIYSVLYFSWLVIPRKVAFYYYYYPAGMTLSLALAFVFKNLEKGPLFAVKWARWVFFAAALGIFIYFFPILAALKIPSDSFRRWMWVSSWI